MIQRVTFRSSDTGYHVLQVILEDGMQTAMVGNSAELREGMHIRAQGDYKEHPKFGRQFVAVRIEACTPSDPKALQRYLSSGLIHGIGEKTADRIISAFGTEALKVLRQNPERVAALPGVGKQKAQAILEHLEVQGKSQSAIQFLLAQGLNPSLAQRIYEHYGPATTEIVSKDPYLLARDIRGIGFAIADSVALNIGLRPDSPQRVRAGILHALEKAADDGHTHLAARTLSEKTQQLLALSEGLDLSLHLESVLRERLILRVDDTENGDSSEPRYALRYLIEAEQEVARWICGRLQISTPSPLGALASTELANCLVDAEAELGVQLSEDQRRAVQLSTQSHLLLITGGPGCGKTTLIRALCALCSRAKLRLQLAAPTGRAAQRMAHVSGHPASTIHRLLKYDPFRQRFTHSRNDPLNLDVLIIDETSMLDVLLARDLFTALPEQAVVILVGDKDQLPSVGPGRVFGDLLEIESIPQVRLSQLFRQKSSSCITRAAHEVNQGKVPMIPEPDGVTQSDAYLLIRESAEQAAQTVVKLVSEQLPKKFDVSPNEILVLTPTNRGPLGTIELNRLLQEKLNPSSELDAERSLSLDGSMRLRIGDRVVQRQNNYQLDPQGVFNGDSGYVLSTNNADKSLSVELWDGRIVKYQGRDISQLSLAYALTVHRSQGSEMPCVVFAMHESQFTLLERQLIYTAVTRAKKLLVVVASRRALELAVRRASGKKRLTSLKSLILQGLN